MTARRRLLASGLTVTLVMGLLMASAAPTAAAAVVDQSQNVQTAPISTFGPGGHVAIGQTFTAGISGSLVQVDLYPVPNGTDRTVEIRDTTAGVPSGPPLASATILAADVPVSGTVMPVLFATPTSVVAGTQYAIVMRQPAGPGQDTMGAWVASSPAPYLGGEMVASGDDGGAWGGIPVFDLTFRTYVDTLGGGGGGGVSSPTLTVPRVGSGSGTITSSPPGINCPPDCSEQVAYGTHFRLTATADAGSVFARWGWTGCPGTGICDVNVDSDMLVPAQFDLASTPTHTPTPSPTPPPAPGTFDLHASKAGKGRIVSDLAGINCGQGCTATYEEGAMVTLNAAPWHGWILKRWRYGCSGQDPVCTVEMSSNRRARAIFVRQ